MIFSNSQTVRGCVSLDREPLKAWRLSRLNNLEMKGGKL